ncbi:reverse transcriptase family protein, partial [Salmonella enterica subsp. enterica serovar London]|nr:reverse transcriptase family protein [Salmonella enterica subsp. enterica serovar London]
MEKLLNVENAWDKNASSGKVEGPSCRITEAEVEKAIGRMKKGKAAGPTGVVTEMLKASQEVGVQWLTDLSNRIIDEGSFPVDWERSVIIPVYKGKGDPLECGSYRAVKLLEHAMKVVERVLEQRIRNQVRVDEMQFGFMPGKGTTDAIFLVRQLQEKYHGKGKKLYYAFVDLEKAFDRVPREVVKWALRKSGVDEWIVRAVMAMYANAQTVVRTT